LGASIRASGSATPVNVGARQNRPGLIGAIVFGSDQGLVGRFNDVVAECAIRSLATMPQKPLVWAVGERVHDRLLDGGLELQQLYNVPNSVDAITPLVGNIQLDSERILGTAGNSRLYIFHNRPNSRAGYVAVSQQLLPLDRAWQQGLSAVEWPTSLPPELLGKNRAVLQALIREYLFISLFRAAAESLASENASRLAAMERADKNIQATLEELRLNFNRSRQQVIDEELFDLISGFEALASVAADDV
jgi:F-type H+-transporting ATPase subunit gamma